MLPLPQEKPMLDIVTLLGTVVIFVTVGLIAKGVEKL